MHTRVMYLRTYNMQFNLLPIFLNFFLFSFIVPTLFTIIQYGVKYVYIIQKEVIQLYILYFLVL